MAKRPKSIREALRFIKRRSNWVLPSPKELETALGYSEGYGHRIYKALETEGEVIRKDGRYYLANDPRAAE